MTEGKGLPRLCVLPPTGRDQHHVWLRGPDPKVSGCKQVDIPRGLRGQGRDVDRDPSAAGGGAHAGSGLASGKP